MNNQYELHNINGYYLLLIPYNNKTITIRSNINTGYINENKENLGINHLLEHVLVNGNKLCKNKDCISHLNKNGINMNASTSFKTIMYYNSGLSQDTLNMIKYIIETTLSYKNINKNVLDKEKKAIINELLTASNSGMYDIHNLSANKFFKLFGEKNYYNYDLQIKNLDKLNAGNLIDYFNNNYNEILFTVIGDFNKFEIINTFNLFLPKNKNNYINNNKNFNECFTLNNSINFIKNNDLANTIFYFSFPADISMDLISETYTEIINTYLKDYIMFILRAKEHLIYGLTIESDNSYCGNILNITINVKNENALKVYNKLIQIIKDSYKNIDMTFISGIIKKMKNEYFNYSKESIENFYTKQILNIIFNKNNYKIINYRDYIYILDNINYDKLLDYLKKIINIDQCLTVYSSNKMLNL